MEMSDGGGSRAALEYEGDDELDDELLETSFVEMLADGDLHLDEGFETSLVEMLTDKDLQRVDGAEARSGPRSKDMAQRHQPDAALDHLSGDQAQRLARAAPQDGAPDGDRTIREDDALSRGTSAESEEDLPPSITEHESDDTDCAAVSRRSGGADAEPVQALYHARQGHSQEAQISALTAAGMIVSELTALVDLVANQSRLVSELFAQEKQAQAADTQEGQHAMEKSRVGNELADRELQWCIASLDRDFANWSVMRSNMSSEIQQLRDRMAAKRQECATRRSMSTSAQQVDTLPGNGWNVI